jgi:PRC-barrel domain
MATPSIETVRGWRGRVMVDRDSNKIGEVVDIYLDNETDRPEWAVVRTGLFGLRSTFVPLAEAREVGDELQVPHQRLQVKQAPNIEPDGQLSAAEEAELYRHYGLDYDSVTLDSGAPAGQALAEPAGQTRKPDRDEQAGATAIGVPEPASTATGGWTTPGWTPSPGPQPLRPGAPAWVERLPPASSSRSRVGAVLAMSCRPAAAGSRWHPPAKTNSRWVRG